MALTDLDSACLFGMSFLVSLAFAIPIYWLVVILMQLGFQMS